MKIVFSEPVLSTYPATTTFYQARIEVTNNGIVGNRTLEHSSALTVLAKLSSKITLLWRIAAPSVTNVTPVGKIPSYYRFTITDD